MSPSRTRHGLPLAAASSLVTALLAGGAAAAPAGAADEAERLSLAAASPEAAAWVASAEIEARAGHAQAAWALYARAWEAAPKSVLPARGICCLALTLPGGSAARQSAAAAACRTALARGGTSEDMRNEVAATVLGPAAPTMQELQAASFMADGAAHRAGGELWGYAARADIAWWLGDRELLDASLADLRGVAPDHDQTRRVEALASPRASLWVWLGRLAVGAAWLVTAAHAFARRARAKRLALVAAAALAVMGVARPAAAQQAEPSAPADPLALSDLLMTRISQAEKATAGGDHAAAARAWEAVTRATPERAYGFARLCDALEAAGQRERALAACRTALVTQGTTASDYTHLVKLLLANPGPLSASDRRQIDVALGALATDPRAALIAERVRCDVAAHDHDRTALEACTAKLAAAAPDDWRTSAFSWALAFDRGDTSETARQFARAHAGGAPAETLARMEAGTRTLRARRLARVMTWAIAGATATVVVALVGAFVGRVLARRRSGEVEA